MITYEEARKIGINACIEKLGRSYVEQYRDNSCAGYGQEDEFAFCFVGVDDQPIGQRQPGEGLTLDDSSAKYQYMATCNVWYEDGRIEFLECNIPA